MFDLVAAQPTDLVYFFGFTVLEHILRVVFINILIQRANNLRPLWLLTIGGTKTFIRLCVSKYTTSVDLRQTDNDISKMELCKFL